MEERLIVFGESKAPWLIMLGAVFATAILILGDRAEASIQFDGIFSPLTELYRGVIRDHSGKGALTIMGSSLVGAWKAYKRTRRRMLGY